jgi:hypothetical protein
MNLTEEQQNIKVKTWNWDELLMRCELEEAEGDENFGMEIVEDQSSEYEFGQKGEISKYLLLNKGLRSFIKLIVDHSPSDESAPVISSADEKILWRGFDAYKDVIAHKKKLELGRFKWERWSEGLERISLMIHRYNKIDFPLFPQIVDPEIFQLAFPVPLIKSYMYSPFLGDYLRPSEFLPVLTLQTDLARLFLIFHLKADTKFLSRMDSDQLGIIDPFSRNYMRINNRIDPMFAEGGKYNCEDFDIKSYLRECIKIFFQPLGFCEITGYDFYLQSTILETLRYTLELGIWKYQELRSIVTLLFEKIQALISFRERYLVEIVKHQSDTVQKSTLEKRIEMTKDTGFTKSFLDNCREQCAAICLQIIFLINDDEVHEAFHSKERYNPKDSEYIEKAWEFGYFSNIEFNYLINSIFTTFIIKFTPDETNKNLSMMTNKILMLITDRSNDDFYSSMELADEKSYLWFKDMLAAYESKDKKKKPKMVVHTESIAKSAIATKKKLIDLLDAVTKGKENGTLAGIEMMTKELKEEWEKRTKGKKPDEIQKYKMALACENVPTIIVTLANLVIELTTLKTDNCSEDIIAYLLNICDDNDIAISLLFCYSSIDKMKAWLFDDPIKVPFTLRYVLSSDTTEPYQLLYSHTSVFESVLEGFSVTIDLFEESLGGGSFDQNEYYDYWSNKESTWKTEPITEEIEESMSYQHDLLLSIYLYNTMFIDLIRKGNDTFLSKFYDVQILKILNNMINKLFKGSAMEAPHEFLGLSPDCSLDHYDRMTSEDFRKLKHIKRGQVSKDSMKWLVITVLRSCFDLVAKSTKRGYTLVGLLNTTQWVNQASANLDFPKLTSNTIHLLRFRSSYLETFSNVTMGTLSSCFSLPNSVLAELKNAIQGEGNEADANKIDIAEKLDLDQSPMIQLFGSFIKEMEQLQTIDIAQVFNFKDDADKMKVLRSFRKYLYHGLFPGFYKATLIILHYSRSGKYSVEKHIMTQIGQIIENFLRAFFKFRTSPIFQELKKIGVLFDSPTLAVLGGVKDMNTAPAKYALSLLNTDVQKVELLRRSTLGAGNEPKDKKEKKGKKEKVVIAKDEKEAELVKLIGKDEEKKELKKEDVDDGIPELKDDKKDNQTDEGKKDEKVEKKAKKEKKDKKEKGKKKEKEKKKKKNVDQWWRTVEKTWCGGMLTEELIIEYDLDEEEAAAAWMESVQMVFKDLAEFIEYNHQQIDEQFKDTHLTCSKILQMFQREVPSPGYSVKNKLLKECKLNGVSSGCLEKFYKDYGNLQDVASRDIPRNDFKRFEHLRLLYREKKRNQITKGVKKNHFILFLNSQKGKGEAIIYYIISVINFYVKEIMSNPEACQAEEIQKEDAIVFALLTNDYILSLNIFLDNMFFEHEFFIQCLLNIVKGGYLEYEDLRVHAERILSQHQDANRNFKKHADQTEKDIEARLEKSITEIEELEKVGQAKMKAIGCEYLSINYFIIMNFGRCCAFKVFVESNWRNLWDRFYISTNIFKNICESNNQTFKVFLSDFKPEFGEIKMLPNPEDMLLDDFFNRLRPLMESNRSWKNNDGLEHASDQVDKFPVIQRYLEIFSVFVNEGCLRNQSTFFSLGEEYWPGIMRRMPDDVNSNFYRLKITVIKYLIAITDKSSQIISNYIAYNFPPSYISELIYVHMKKLYCYAILENDPSKYEKLMEQIHEEKTKNEKKTKEKKKKAKEVRFGGKLIKVKETKYFPVPPEMCDLITIKNFSQIKEAYLYNPSMYGHPLLELCVQLNIFIDTLANQSPVYKLYKGYLNTQVLNIYGALTPGRLRKDLDTDVAYVKDDRPETIDIQMALATFTEEIEVGNEQVSSNKDEQEPTKKVLFIVPPETFLLTPETKEKMTQGVPVDQLVKVIQEKFEVMSIQMRNSLAMYRRWPWFFYLASPEVMNVHKKVIWGVSFAINILLGLRNSTTLEGLSEGILKGINPIQLAVNALAIANAFYSFLQLVTWTLNKYREVVETVALEYQQAESKILTLENRGKSWITRSLTKIDVYVVSPFITKDSPLMFILQALFNLLGAYLSDFFFTLNLWMVILLGSNVRQMIISIRDNWAKMLMTLALTLFVTYSTGFIGAAAGGAKKCETIWGCFTQVLGFNPAEGASGGSEAIITNLIFGTIVAAFSAQQKDDKEIGIL